MSIATEISRLQSAKADIKTSIEGKGVTVPSATTLDGYSALIDSITTTPTLQTKSVSITPTTSSQSQTVTPDGGYDGLDEVSISVSAMPSGTAGTPTATKGTVSGNSVTVTPSVTNTTGYITGGTKTGTGVSVSASELVSGTLSVTSNGTVDVTNYASAEVNVSGGGGLQWVEQLSGSINISDGFLIDDYVSSSTTVWRITLSNCFVNEGAVLYSAISGNATFEILGKGEPGISSMDGGSIMLYDDNDMYWSMFPDVSGMTLYPVLSDTFADVFDGTITSLQILQ